MIADVVFDAPLDHPFSYRVPSEWPPVAPGQRVIARLGGARRRGLVVALAAGDGDGLLPLAGLLDAVPVLTPGSLDIARWIASETLAGLGSVALALCPPVGRRAGSGPALCGATPERGRAREVAELTAPLSAVSFLARTGAGAARPGEAPGSTAASRGSGSSLRVLCGPARASALVTALAEAPGPALLLVPDSAAAGRWARCLAASGPRGRRVDGPIGRLDAAAGDAERAASWAALAAGRGIAIGTRSALLAPSAPGGVLALLDEHDAAHCPPGPPRIHPRRVVLERSRREGVASVFATATPSVELWWAAHQAGVVPEGIAGGAGPGVALADTRGLGRATPLAPAALDALRATVARGGRALLIVARRASALACDDCGAVVSCPECGAALAHWSAERTVTCRICGRTEGAPERCPACRGARLAGLGWGGERLADTLGRLVPGARVARVDLRPAGRRRGGAAHVDWEAPVLVAASTALRALTGQRLELVIAVAPDQLLGRPDFRAAERTLGLLWAAGELVAPGGQLIVQSRVPDHYAYRALAGHDLPAFYAHELGVRASLGYPPFGHIAVATFRGRRGADAREQAGQIASLLEGDRTLTVYPPTVSSAASQAVSSAASQAVSSATSRAVSSATSRAVSSATSRAAGGGAGSFRVVVKGGEDLAERLALALQAAPEGWRRRRGIMQVEIDPLEWPS